MQNPLDSVVYISLPEGFSVPSNAFQIDVTVPLPVQKPAGNEPFDISTLSWEMILAGILTIMAYEKENVHFKYEVFPYETHGLPIGAAEYDENWLIRALDFYNSL